ncbi:hypothetical protein FGL95_01945 [Nocardiaceae bacterium YC2-7]|uniref:Uncharacterized protein n=1 Tax=Antrihabitans stalactiti TaxID=2584121 RepID=A0A848K5D7_9NOCA|nr:hypothetical protein [Antrihabitans stalactiti]
MRGLITNGYQQANSPLFAPGRADVAYAPTLRIRTADLATAENLLATTVAAASLPESVREIEEVVPVNAVTTWVLPSRVTVGR